MGSIIEYGIVGLDFSFGELAWEGGKTCTKNFQFLELISNFIGLEQSQVQIIDMELRVRIKGDGFDIRVQNFPIHHRLSQR